MAPNTGTDDHHGSNSSEPSTSSTASSTEIVQQFESLTIENGSSQRKYPKSMWDPNVEKAACGVGFIVNIQAQASNRVC